MPQIFRDFAFDESMSNYFENVFAPKNTYKVTESDSFYALTMELPGFSKEQIKVTIKNNVLSVSAKKEDAEITKSFLLNATIDTEKINAAAFNGILTVNLPKTMDATLPEGRMITVQ